MADYTPEQQAKNRREWVEALRSGDYQQGQGALLTGDRFCCLGVACEISGLAEWNGHYYLGQDCALPDEVMDWLGLRDYMGEWMNGDTLAARNDTGKTFREIADLIESEPQGLLKEASND